MTVEATKEILVEGSHGTLTVNPWGEVLRYEPADSDESYADIVRIDTGELMLTYGELRDAYDILDVGYWTADREYVEPDYSFRDNVAYEKSLDSTIEYSCFGDLLNIAEDHGWKDTYGSADDGSWTDSDAEAAEEEVIEYLEGKGFTLVDTNMSGDAK